jgi:hypothetical protein
MKPKKYKVVNKWGGIIESFRTKAAALIFMNYKFNKLCFGKMEIKEVEDDGG